MWFDNFVLLLPEHTILSNSVNNVLLCGYFVHVYQVLVSTVGVLFFCSAVVAALAISQAIETISLKHV